MGGQKSDFFEISIEIKSAQPVSCSQVSSFDTTAGTAVLISPPLGPRATCRGAVIGIHWGGTRGSRSGGGAWGRNRRWKVRELRGRDGDTSTDSPSIHVTPSSVRSYSLLLRVPGIFPEISLSAKARHISQKILRNLRLPQAPYEPGASRVHAHFQTVRGRFFAPAT